VITITDEGTLRASVEYWKALQQEILDLVTTADYGATEEFLEVLAEVIDQVGREA